MTTLSAPERRVLADRLQIAEQYLYQVLTGRREPDPALAVRIWRESGKTIQRWDLRPNDWHHIWPELVGTKGAPKLAKVA